MGVSLTHRKGGYSSFPNIISFEFDPEDGPYVKSTIRKPFQEWHLYEETARIIAKKTTLAAASGGAFGATFWGIGNQLSKVADYFKITNYFPDIPIRNLQDCVAVGVGFGAFFGAIQGIWETRALRVNLPLVKKATRESSEQARKVIKAFVASYTKSQEFIDNLTCPISLEVMIFPVKANCNKKVPHIFEYSCILDWLKRNNTCPVCRSTIQIKDLTHDKDKEKTIHREVSEIFKRMEALLRTLPSSCDGSPNLANQENIKILIEKAKEGKNFLEKDNVIQLAEKLKNSKPLSLEETYGLAYFLIQQFKPLKEKITQVYEIAGDHLRDLQRENKIDRATFKQQWDQLEKWYDKFDIIPQECEIIRNLYSL